MNHLLMTGSAIVFLALASYATAVTSQARQHRVSDLMLRFLVLGVCLDAIATGFMIAGSSKGLFTTHGILGYTALGGMLLDLALVWRFRAREGSSARLPGWLHAYSLAAFGWWVLAFILGAILALRLPRPV